MPKEDIYLGPDWRDTEATKTTKPVGVYTVVDQARSWGVPDEQLVEEVPSADVKET